MAKQLTDEEIKKIVQLSRYHSLDDVAQATGRSLAKVKRIARAKFLQPVRERGVFDIETYFAKNATI